MGSYLRRLLITAALVLVVISLAGATYQGVATAFERRDFPPPGHKIDVGGHQLHIYCTGDGAPAVILEAPATGMSAAWAWVQPQVASHTRVCSYDRAGLGWSEAGDRPYDPRNVPIELHALLSAERVPRPYILVGQSLGAAFARLYAAAYPGDVAALMLVDDATAADPSHGVDSTERRSFTRFITYSPWLARTGLLRVTRLLSSQAEGLPQPAAGAVRTFLNRPDHLTRASREMARWDETMILASQAAIPEGRLVIRLRTGAAEPGAFLTQQAAGLKVSEAILRLLPPQRRR